MIKTVILFWNGHVAVCDERGQQMQELQGHYSDVVERLRAQDLTQVEIFVAETILEGGSNGTVSPEEFLNLKLERATSHGS